MTRPPRTLSRIAVRLLAFNLLLVFLPAAGVLFLGTYEELAEAFRKIIDDYVATTYSQKEPAQVSR